MDRDLGFIGLGRMGNPMARTLLRAGARLSVYDINRDAAERVAQAGARSAESVRGAAEGKDVVITMLPSSPEVEEVVLGAGGLLDTMRPGSTLLEMSTIAPSTTRRVATALMARAIKMVDAPVVGGQAGAESGTLTLMVGGEQDAIEGVRDILAALGKTIHYAGVIGNGEVVKLIGNLAGAILTAASCEALVLGVKAGVPAETIAAVLRTTVGGWLWERTIPQKVLKGDFEPGFTADLMHKDLGLAIQTAHELGVPLTLGALVRERYTEARARGWGSKDWTVILRILEGASGVEARASS
jgi:3-hydroxyisobutyrate dehydrogenase